MEDMYCYACGQVQHCEKSEPRIDWDDKGEVEITDITCETCKRRIRLKRRLS